jgi:hypothetical protein
MKENTKVKTLSDQMEEYFLRKEKVENFEKELFVDSGWKIFFDEDEGMYFIEGYGGWEYPINVELRERLPNSYFHKPMADKDIIGYDPYTGAIIYNLWGVGKTEMLISEGISSDFHDTGYGIDKLLCSFEKYGFGSKVPPTHILPSGFINYQNDLQGSMNEWGLDINIVKANISEIEQRRLHLCEHIAFYVKLLEHISDQPEDFRNSNQKILDDLKKEYAALE